MNNHLTQIIFGVLIGVLLANGIIAYGQEPNIALEQYVTQKYIEEIIVEKKANWELTVEELNKMDWEEAMLRAEVEASKGKMIYTICDELTGLCHTDWKYQERVPSGQFTVTNQFGETRIVYAYCGEGTFWNEPTQLCELTDDEKKRQKNNIIGLGIIIMGGGTIIAIILVPHIKEEKK